MRTASLRWATPSCRSDAGAFQAAVKAAHDEVMVACTQEAALFSEIAEKPIKFVNIRELAGWSPEKSTPKMAAPSRNRNIGCVPPRSRTDFNNRNFPKKPASGGIPATPIGPRVTLSQLRMTSAMISPMPSVAIDT